MKKFLRQLAFLFPLGLLAGCGGQGGNAFTDSSSIVSSGQTSGSGGTSGGTTTGSGGGSTTGTGSTGGSGTTGGTGTTTGTSGTTGGSTTGSTTGGGSSPQIPSNARTISDIQKMSNWESCTDCAGGAFAAYSMTTGITAPSLSGSSARFSLEGGTAPWGQALWWKYLTADNSVTHFIYDLYFYVDIPSAAQALEFTVSHSTGANRYEYATQCDLGGSHTWRSWNPTKHGWDTMGISCPTPSATSWNHLVWEFERNSSNQVVFKAVTLNGTRSDINFTQSRQSDSSSGIDISFQMDAKDGPTLFSVWLDKVNLIYW
jgi:hypothetical protein